MKTVYDAVNELKGEWDLNPQDGDEQVALHQRKLNPEFPDNIIGGIRKGYTGFCSDIYSKICTIEEFNALLAEMETNFGKYTGPKFDASKATELEVSKVNIDWSKEPEATHYCPSNKQFSEVFIKDLTGKGYSYRVVGNVYSGGEWEAANPIIRGELFGIIERPKEPQPPVYTQEMLDNGECPKLGAKFEVANIEGNSRILDFKGLTVTVIGLSITESNKQVVTFEHETRGVGCGVFRKFWVKPLPPKQELFDGEAYQFDYNGKTRKGYYLTVHDQLMFSGGCARGSACTNITLLTPEEK